MFPFWHDVVAPIIEAVHATRIVEIGALRGEHTELMLQRLGPDVELHVIDPLPAFDPAEHEAKFPGQYVFHRDLSVNVLGSLPPVDVALIDGDHNWYTVFTELNMLSDVARRAGVPMPVMIMHDVSWPYGRRDLYYDPSNIPDEHRQPWRRGGMRPGQVELLQRGGLNADLANAEVEGGPRNGVMTGVDDFIAGYDKPLRLVFLPIFFGLAVVAEEERLAAQPELAARLDWLESVEGKDVLLQLGEDIRVESIIFDQAMIRSREDRAAQLADRYLDTIQRAIVADPQVGGDQSAGDTLDHVRACLDRVWGSYVQGDVAVMGARSGPASALVAAYLEANDPEIRPRFRRKLWIAEPSTAAEGAAAPNRTRKLLRRMDLLSGRVRLVEDDTARSEMTHADRRGRGRGALAERRAARPADRDASVVSASGGTRRVPLRRTARDVRTRRSGRPDRVRSSTGGRGTAWRPSGARVERSPSGRSSSRPVSRGARTAAG
jgi:hypothetical protein